MPTPVLDRLFKKANTQTGRFIIAGTPDCGPEKVFQSLIQEGVQDDGSFLVVLDGLQTVGDRTALEGYLTSALSGTRRLAFMLNQGGTDGVNALTAFRDRTEMAEFITNTLCAAGLPPEKYESVKTYFDIVAGVWLGMSKPFTLNDILKMDPIEFLNAHGGAVSAVDKAYIDDVRTYYLPTIFPAVRIVKDGFIGTRLSDKAWPCSQVFKAGNIVVISQNSGGLMPARPDRAAALSRNAFFYALLDVVTRALEVMAGSGTRVRIAARRCDFLQEVQIKYLQRLPVQFVWFPDDMESYVAQYGGDVLDGLEGFAVFRLGEQSAQFWSKAFGTRKETSTTTTVAPRRPRYGGIMTAMSMIGPAKMPFGKKDFSYTLQQVENPRVKPREITSLQNEMAICHCSNRDMIYRMRL